MRFFIPIDPGKGHGTPYRRDYRDSGKEEARLKEQNFGKYESTPRDGAEFREAKNSL